MNEIIKNTSRLLLFEQIVNVRLRRKGEGGGGWGLNFVLSYQIDR